MTFDLAWRLFRDLILLLIGILVLAQVTIMAHRQDCAAQIGEMAYWEEKGLGEFQCVRVNLTHRRRG